MTDGEDEASTGAGRTPFEVLDRQIDGLASGRGGPAGRVGDPVGTPGLGHVLGRLASLGQEEWERAAPLAELPGAVPPRVARHAAAGRSHGRRVPSGRSGRILVASAAAAVVVAGVLVAASFSGQPPQTPHRGTTVVPAAWRLAGHIDQPAWQLGGSAAGVGQSPVLTCPSSAHCFAVDPWAPLGAGVLEASTDGGATWAATQLPTGWQFTSGLTCPATARCLAGGVEGAPPGNPTAAGATAVILQSTTAASTWRAVPLPGQVAVVTDLACTGGACVGAGYGSPAAPTGGDPVVVVGPEGGPWTVVDLPAGFTPSDPAGLSCPSTSACVVVGTVATTAGGAAGGLFSTDGGRTWSPASVPAGLAALHAASCSDVAHCIAIGREEGTSASGAPGVSEAITTADGGRTWSVVGTLATQSLRLTAVWCTSPASCRVAGRSAVAAAGAILRTTDGGGSWTADQLPTSTGPGGSGTPVRVQNVASISCAPGGPCTAVGGGTAANAKTGADATSGQIVLRSVPVGGS